MQLLENFVLTYVCNSLWQAPLVLAGGWLAARLFARMGLKAQHRVWTISLLAALLMPAVGRSFAQIDFHAGSAASKVVQPAPFVPQTLTFTRQEGAVALPVGVADGLLIVYGFLLIAAVSRFAFGVLRTRRLMRASQPAILSPEDADLFARCRKAFCLGETEMRVHPGLSGPVTCGWRQQLLILPEGFLATSERDDLLSAFAHEAAHMERRDFFWNGVLAFVTLPVAYHPAAWFLQSRIAESRELLCDHLAATRVLNAHRYATSLFRLASRISRERTAISIHAIGIFDANILEKRMKKLSEKVSVPGRQAALVRVAASIILAGCVLFAGSRLAVRVTPVEAAVSKTNAVPPERVFTVGNGVTAPVLTHSVDPEFPKNAGKPSGAGGVCVLNLVVGRDGRVMRVHVVRSIDAAFDRNAMAAVRQYRFDPALKEGNPVAVSVNIEVNFKRY